MQKPILTVSEVNRYIKGILDTNVILSSVIMRGEISNYKNHYSGHMYFTLKDDTSSIKSVMFKSACVNLKFEPRDGMKVIVQGRVSVFERDGNYQMYIDDMQPDGIGSLHLAFEQLKARLELEGLFDSTRKIKIPSVPNAIGIVTSPTGAAVKDMLNVLSRRFYNIKVVVFPVQVQGEGSSQQIASAIDTFNKLKNVDVIIVGRGGGSIEELWAFNEEIVARSISRSKIPIISAVGHETDYTISDFVADLRAPTPSAAAELAVLNKSDIQAMLDNLFFRLKMAVQAEIEQKKSKLERQLLSSSFKYPLDSIYKYRLELDLFNKGILKDIGHQIDNKCQLFKQLVAKLNALSPLNILQRGYCISKDGYRIIKSVSQVNIGDKVQLQYFDGYADCTIVNIDKGELS